MAQKLLLGMIRSDILELESMNSTTADSLADAQCIQFNTSAAGEIRDFDDNSTIPTDEIKDYSHCNKDTSLLNATIGLQPGITPVEQFEYLTTVTVVLQWLGYFSMPLLLLTGILGNLLSIVIMQKPVFRNLSFSILVTALSVSDLVVSLMFPFNKQFVMNFLQWDIRSQGWLGCRIFFGCWRFFKITASWLVALISVERFLGVGVPIHVKQICTKRNAYIAVGCLYLVIGSFVVTMSSYVDHMIEGKCLPNYPKPKTAVTLTKAFIVAGSSLYCYIPACLILIFNVLIIRKIHQGYAPMGKSQRYRRRKPGIKTWTMLVSISIAYFVLAIPIGFVHGFAVFTGVSIFESQSVTIVLFREIAQLLEQGNHVVNFFAYVLCNQRFRKELRGLASKNEPVLQFRSRRIPHASS